MSQQKTTELTVVERAALALGTSEREAKLWEMVSQSTGIVAIKNAAGRDQCHGALMTLRNTRTDITKAGKAARDDANAFSKAVIAEEKRLVSIIEPEEERLQTLRDAWDEAREAEKRAAAEKEAKRIALIREHIDDIRAIVSRVAGRSAAYIESEITDLVALQIDVARFAELTGEAEMVRGTTLDKLRELHAAAVAQEAEAKRIAEEAERLARERAAFEEEQRRAAAERAEQERKEAEARATREAEERAAREVREAEERTQRERDDAARREQQAREDAERRAALDAEEKRLAAERAEQERVRAEEQARMDAERAEMARRQAELDRVEAEQREREAQAAREAKEREAAAAREQQKREREDFLVQGPGLDALVDVIGAHYNVESSTVMHWLFIYDVPATTAPAAA